MQNRLYWKNPAKRQQIDLRQRLTVSRRHGVAEIYIPEGSDYIGKTIRDSGLREKNIMVLALHLDTKVIPNPKSERQLEAEDRLLCFGKLKFIRELIPAKTSKKRRAKLKVYPIYQSLKTHKQPDTLNTFQLTDNK